MQLLYILFFLFIGMQQVQNPQLPLNAAGKVEFQDFVAVEELGRDALFKNALNYAAGLQKVSDREAKGLVNFREGFVQREGSFYVYKQGLLTPQVHGEIKYTLRLTVEDGGYTYTFSDFIFQYYEKNRYGRYEAVSGKKKALEKDKFAGMQDLWEEHKKTTRQHIDQHIAVLKTKMKEVPPGALLYDQEKFEEQN